MSTIDTASDASTVSPNDPRLLAWRAFLEAHARVARRLDDELRSEHDLSLAEYDALLQLAEAPGRRLRMNQLADRVVLSRSGVTRLIDRLVDDGFVARAQCSSDARGAEAVLTHAGLDRLRAAARTHLRGIERHFLAIVPTEDLDVVGRALADVARHSCPSGIRPADIADRGALADPLADPLADVASHLAVGAGGHPDGPSA